MIRILKLSEENYRKLDRQVRILRGKLGSKNEKPTLRIDRETGEAVLFVPRCWISPNRYLVGWRQFVFDSKHTNQFYHDLC
jgi:hypothetical protein